MVVRSRRARVALVAGMVGAGGAGLAAAALAADGQPDPTFAEGRPAAFVPNSLSDDLRFPSDLTVDGAATPTGGAIVVGDAPASEGERRRGRPEDLSGALAIAKLTPAGEPDLTFGDDDGEGADGVVSVNYGGSPLATVQRDGSVVVVSASRFGSGAELLRTDAAGTEVERQDLTPPEGCERAEAAALDATGRVVVAWSCEGTATVVRSYAGDAFTDVRLDDGTRRFTASMALLPDGRVVLADVTTDEDGDPVASRVLVVSAQGAPQAIDLGEGVIARSVRAAADGSVAVASESPAEDPAQYDVLVLEADGTVDTSQARRLAVPAGLSSVASSALPRPTGGVVIQTTSELSAPRGESVLIGYKADGSLDTSFGTNGIDRYDAAGDPALEGSDSGSLAGSYGPLVSYATGAVGVPVGVYPLLSLRAAARQAAAPAPGSIEPPVLGFLKRSGSLPTPPATTTATTPTTVTTTPTTVTTTPTTVTTTPTTVTTTPTTVTTAPSTTTEPVTATAPSQSTTPSTTTTAPAPPAAAPTIAVLPAPPARALRYCQSRRTIKIRLGRGVPKRVLRRVTSATVTVAGKRIQVSRLERLRSRVVLTSLPYGRFTVRITLRTKGGKVLRDVRRYRTCRVGDSDRPARTVGGVPVG